MVENGIDFNAIQGLRPDASSAQRATAALYLNQLCQSNDGWHICLKYLLTPKKIPLEPNADAISFFCMQVVENFLKSKRYMHCQDGVTEIQQYVHQFVKDYSQIILRAGQSAQPIAGFLRNKFSQLVALVCVADFPAKWPNLFHLFLEFLPEGGVPAMDLFVKVLSAVDSEVVDRDIAHTPEETERNTKIKDALRDTVVQHFANVWLWGLQYFENVSPETVCSILDAIGLYISWIDINLIANEQYVAQLLSLFNNNLIREKCCDCVSNILSKGMVPSSKVQLVESFYTVLEDRMILGTQAFDQETDEDYLSRVAHMVEVMGCQLIEAYQKYIKEEKGGMSQESLRVLNCLEAKVDLALHLLGHDDDSISSEVATITHEYIGLLKTMRADSLSESRQNRVRLILLTIIKKMKYDESYDACNEGEEEAIFQEYRKELKVIFTNLCGLDANLLQSAVHEMLLAHLRDWRQLNWQDVEVSIALLYQLGEALPPAKVGDHFAGDSESARLFREMLAAVCASGVSGHQHPLVVLQYLETVARFDKFFRSGEPEIRNLLGGVLIGFLDNRGLRHPHPKVRARSAYLLSRFVKTLKSQVEVHAEAILQHMQDLLTPLDMVQSQGEADGLSVSDRVFVYETAGVLIVSGGAFTPERKAELFNLLLEPLTTEFPALCGRLAAETDPVRRQLLAETGKAALDLAGRTSKAFNTTLTMRACGCAEPFVSALRLFLDGLGRIPAQEEVLASRALLCAGVRGLVHRLVVCLEEEVLELVPGALEQLLPAGGAAAEPRDLHDSLALFNQLILKFKNLVEPLLQQSLPGLLLAVFSVLERCRALEGNAGQTGLTESRLLARGYYGFLHCVINSGLARVYSQAEVLDQVLQSLLDGVAEPDPLVQKSAVGSLKLLTQQWAGPGVEPGFGEWLLHRLAPALLLAPAAPGFLLTDGQTAIALQECAACQITMLEKMGDTFTNYLKFTLLPELQVPPNTIIEYLGALSTNHKTFYQYLKKFYTQQKQTS